MGKNNKKKKQKAKQKPKQNNEEKFEFALSSDIETGANLKSRMQDLILALSGQFDEDVVCALATISGFVLESKGAEVFLSSNCIPKVSSLLLHTNAEIRETAIGTFQNLFLTTAAEASKALLNNNIVETFMQIFKQVNAVFIETTNQSLLSNEQLQKEMKFLVELLDLFTTMCEHSSKMVDSLDLTYLLEFILNLLKQDTFTHQLKIKAAFCLFTISEDNERLVSLATSHPAVLKEFSSVAELFIQKNQLLPAILTAGFSHNVCSSPDIIDSLLQLAAQCLSFNILENLKKEAGAQMLEDGSHIIQAQCVSLEIISNMLCSGGDDESWDEEESDENTLGDPTTSVQLDAESLEKINQLIEKIRVLSVPEMVLSKCSLPKEEDLPTSLIESLHKLQIRSWQCLSNILSATPSTVTSSEEIQSVWKIAISLPCEQNGNLRDIEVNLLDAISSTMRALVEKAVLTNYLQIVGEDVIRFSQAIFTQDKLLDSTYMNFASMLGMIGKECAETNKSDALMSIGKIFVDILKKSTVSLLVVSEVLDATFDSFADGSCVDDVLKTTTLLDTLRSLTHTIRNRMKSERKTLAENYGVIEMTRVNLNRFLKYKGR